MPHLVDAPVEQEEAPEVVPPGQVRLVTRLEMPAAASQPAGSSGPAPVALEPQRFCAADIARYEADLLRRAALLTRGDLSRARDLVQDSFERAIRSVHRVVPGSNLRAWLYTILANRYQDLCRSDRTRRVVPLEDEHPSVPGAEPPPRWAAVTPADLKAALAGLSPRSRALMKNSLVSSPPCQKVLHSNRGATSALLKRQMVIAERRVEVGAGLENQDPQAAPEAVG